MAKEHFPYVAIVSVVAVVAVVILLLSLRTTTQAPVEQEESTAEALAGEAVTISMPNAIQRGQYFALYDAAYDKGLRSVNGLHLYRYMGADAPSSESPKIRLKYILTGETVDLNYVYQDYAGGIKGGAYLRVGLFQDYAGGVDESRDYYLILSNNQPTSQQKDSPLFVSTNPELGAEKIQFKNTGTVRLQ